MAGERCDCPERLCEAAGPRGASDPAAFALLSHLLEAPEAGRPGPGPGESCRLPFPFLPQARPITQQLIPTPQHIKIPRGQEDEGTLPPTVTGQRRRGHLGRSDSTDTS